MKSYNQAIAEAFNEIADLLGIKGEGFFTVNAYRSAARLLAEETDPIYKKEATVENFKKLPKIGQALAQKMVEFIETEELEFLNQLRSEIPESVRNLLDIPGLGPKRIGQLYVQAGVTSKKELIKQAASGALKELPGFGEKMVDKILAAIDSDQQKKKRHERKEVEAIAKILIPLLNGLEGVKQVQIAGSYRRGSKTVGDMDILVTGKVDPQGAEKKIHEQFKEMTVLGSGDTKVSFVIFPNNLQVDVRFVPEESYGAALLYFTGSKDFNIKMRKKAIEMGMMLNEYGLHHKGEIIAGKTEEEVFKKLEMEFVEPEKRK